MRRSWCLFVFFACLYGIPVEAAIRTPVRPPTPATNLDVSGLDEPLPGEHFYLLIFSSQNVIKQPRYCHTWVTAVHAIDQENGPPRIVELHTISWLPATANIRVMALHPEPGRNFGLHETIQDVVLANRERVYLWGPYECRPRTFKRFTVQKEFLDRGVIGYQCTDTIGEAARRGTGCDCIHAITDMDPEYDRRYYPLTAYGKSAGREVVARQLARRNSLIDPYQTHDWLIDALDLSQYPIHRLPFTERYREFLRPFPLVR